MKKRLTVAQIVDAARKNKYLLLKDYDNCQIGFNSMIIGTKEFNKRYSNAMSKKTRYVSFLPCSFHEYLNWKTQYV
jgi:hypothetical protein